VALQLREQQAIRRPPREVLAFMADTTNEPSWHPYAREVHQRSPGPIGVGTIFEGRYRGMGTVRTTITEYQPDSRVVFDSQASAMDFQTTATATSTSGSTDLNVVVTLTPHGIYALMMTLMKPVVRKQFTTRMTAFKNAVEAT
jgi:hypothetical protein